MKKIRAPKFCLWIGLVGLTWILASSQVWTQKLSGEEMKIVDLVKRQSDDAIDFLEQAVNINSGTLNAAGVKQVGKLFSKAFDEIGFQTRWVDLSKTNRAGHVFARRKGSRGKRLVMIGHIDTVFEPDSPFQKYERRGDTARGPGVSDMKGGDVVILFALKALHDAGVLEGTTITVALIGDEEKPGSPLSFVRGDLIAAAKESDIALGFEGSVGPNNATIARRSSSGWMLEVKGKAGHTGRIFSENYGYGAIFEASRILDAFREEVLGEEYLVFSPGIILGGTEVTYDSEKARGTAFGKTNVIPQTVTVHGGIRCISNQQKERALTKMREIVARNLPRTSAKISFSEGYPAMSPTEGNKKLLRMYDRISRDLGHGAITPLDPAARGAADISFVAPYIDALSGLGPHGKGAHSVEDELNLPSVSIATQRAALLIYRLTR